MINIKKFFTPLGFFVFLAIPGFSSASCRDVLAIDNTNSRTFSSTKNLEAAFRELATMAIQHDTRTLQDTSGFGMMLVAGFQMKRQEFLDSVLESNLMTSRQFEERLQQEVEALQSARAQESGLVQQQKEALDKRAANRSSLGWQGVFGTIREGSFSMGPETAPVPVKISNPFDLMVTPVTENIWRRVILLAKTHLPGKQKKALFINYFEDTVNNESENDFRAKTNVTRYQVFQWIDILNALSKLNPPELVEIFPQQKKGDVYILPSEAQWEFAARNRGALTGDQPFTEEQMNEMAWHARNLPGGQDAPPPVGEKEPFVIDGVEFYDLFGGVSEMVQDTIFSLNDPLEGGVDPVSEIGKKVPLRGGSWRSYFFNSLSPSARSELSLDIGNDATGFRLIRERAE